jgi:ribosomal protein L16 Arg81 hydroxylase
MSGCIASFDELISPIHSQHFLRNIFGKQSLHISGARNRFEYLLTWDALNAILAERRMDCLDLRLMKGGEPIARELYTHRVQSEFLGQYDQLSVSRLTDCLRKGATLVLNRFREMHDPTRALSDILENIFSSYVEVVVFAGWHSTQALETHWDPEDTFVLQLLGAKHWRVWQPTRRHALVQDKQRQLVRPKELHWEGDLCAGDLLHIPRGWWHDARPYEKPSLHITFAVRPVTGLDIAKAILIEVEALRANVPRHATNSQQAKYIAGFRSAISTALLDISLPRCLAQIDAKAPSRARLSFPWSATPDVELPETARLHWQPRRMLALTNSDERLRLDALGTTFRFAKVAKAVLCDLIDHRSTTVKELCDRHPHANVRPFVIHLASSGLVAITET